MPVVLIGASVQVPNVYSVLCDDRDAMEQVTGLLLDRGRTELVYLFDHASFSGLRKLEGFREAHKKRGIPLREEAIVHIAPGMDPIFAARQAL